MFEAIKSDTLTRIGYGGARGGSKSHAVRSLAITFSMTFGLKVMVFRRVKKELIENHINPLYKDYPALMERFNRSENILYRPDGSQAITFGFAENDSDIHDFQGTEFDLIFVDEATRCSEYQMKFLETCNRSIGRFIPKMVYTMNPGGVGHSFIKRIFIDKSYKSGEVASRYFFI